MAGIVLTKLRELTGSYDGFMKADQCLLLVGKALRRY